MQSVSFAERLEALMHGVSYFPVRTEQDRELIYRLRYDCYLNEKAITENPLRRYFDRHDEDENVFIFGICYDGQLAGSIRMHICSPYWPTGPGMDVFPEILGPMIERGESFVDPTRFVVDERVRRATSLMPFATLRLAAMAADHFDTEQILATVRIEHTPFYRRIFQLEPLSEPRHYPSLTKPIVMMSNYTDIIRDAVYTRYPVFSSDPEERFELFGPSRSQDFGVSRRASVNDNEGRIFRKYERNTTSLVGS
ncbi:N-acyl amino acid synthase FeeM domain-containing protein [Mangrovicella endophytica]|uniref:N-acyl amino acid synthase FeeM domain-containing protein n=1 Tax=Mangrovicella endophytica TaxID=2066697 RepID=UPI000C9EB35D|nr:hypothetical protein [Mangrovicella endophytica]